RLLREHHIGSHFSNILGFPNDTEESIREHVDALRRLAPDVASFYILTPVPGTEQYEEFRGKGWITETNLDRYDSTTTTWQHPRLSSRSLTDLLFESYRRFYDGRHLVRRLALLGRSSTDYRRRDTAFAHAAAAVQA